MFRIKARVKKIGYMAKRVEIEGEGLYPIPPFLIHRLELGKEFIFTLEYSPFLNCIAISKIQRVYSLSYIINLVAVKVKKLGYSYN